MPDTIALIKIRIWIVVFNQQHLPLWIINLILKLKWDKIKIILKKNGPSSIKLKNEDSSTSPISPRLQNPI